MYYKVMKIFISRISPYKW